MKGKVYIVGAGPGDPELITLKGLKVLQEADVIVYDRLIPIELLNYCKPKSEKIYVGKNIGDYVIQDDINKLLVKKALENKTVVRLKGGDPYVLGRGEEECMYVISNGVECEVIPGVTSAIAVPAYAGIPVTSRLYSASGFTVISATQAEDKLIDADYIPKKGTLIILMGIRKIEELTNLLLKIRDEREPVAVIQNGTTQQQRVVVGVLRDLNSIVKENNITSPAIIVVGEVVKLREYLWKFK
ncbi:MAG: uroporphyrinogen-III C-methyltransferase [Saccharolobus sp.]|jgi:uroporphyrin-III C-methyltransferase|uniref:uroporphyrinogen-III C-methyltransferase n=1 Tax=Saccharolobus sp. TaxID=2100761 RepID=UPI0028CC9481|nr:uroporphyrinogen-III C-methyltransferase [Saccharolobus sp.]MDT7860703.1 uroporphyrinogen-III C-methyltransferase [Saccharolobus sp.]